MPDPVARSIQAMLDHMHAVDERIERMCTTLRKVDASYRDGRLPELRDEDFADILADVDSCCPPREEQGERGAEGTPPGEREANAAPRRRNG